MHRREFMMAGVSAAVAALSSRAAEQPKPANLGMLLYSYALRAKAESDRGFSKPTQFLEFAHQRGAIAVQTSLGLQSSDDAIAIRRTCERLSMQIEGIVSPPKEADTDVERFTAELASARGCGVRVVRTVLLSGRRYEVFNQANDFADFARTAERTLERAAKLAEAQQVALAVENHKDFRTDEQIDLLKRISSEWIGVCLDTGNNLALLEDPHSVVEALAPFVKTVHLKDIGVEESKDGFRMSEVALGRGCFDLPRMVAAVRKANPQALFQLEMITRDPLSIPCLTDKYWATMSRVAGTDLARTLARVRAVARQEPLPRVTTLSKEEQLAAEDRNVCESFEFAAKTGLIAA